MKKNELQNVSEPENTIERDAPVTSLDVIRTRNLDPITTSAICNLFSVSPVNLRKFISDEDNYLFVATALPTYAIAGILSVVFTRSLDGLYARLEERRRVDETHDDVVFFVLVSKALTELVFIRRPKIIELAPSLLGIPRIEDIFTEHFEWCGQNRLTLKKTNIENDQEHVET